MKEWLGQNSPPTKLIMDREAYEAEGAKQRAEEAGHISEAKRRMGPTAWKNIPQNDEFNAFAKQGAHATEELAKRALETQGLEEVPFRIPVGVVTSPDGSNLYVADTADDRIRKVELER